MAVGFPPLQRFPWCESSSGLGCGGHVAAALPRLVERVGGDGTAHGGSQPNERGEIGREPRRRDEPEAGGLSLSLAAEASLKACHGAGIVRGVFDVAVAPVMALRCWGAGAAAPRHLWRALERPEEGSKEEDDASKRGPDEGLPEVGEDKARDHNAGAGEEERRRADGGECPIPQAAAYFRARTTELFRPARRLLSARHDRNWRRRVLRPRTIFVQPRQDLFDFPFHLVWHSGIPMSTVGHRERFVTRYKPSYDENSG